MTGDEAIEILKEIRANCEFNQYDEQRDAVIMAISALEKQVGKNPIGIKVKGQDPYTEVSSIVNDWCMMNYYGSAFVTLSLDGRVTTEYLYPSFNGNNMEFEWDMDWWEGERNVVLLGFRMRSDVMFYGYPNSEDGDEHGTDDMEDE